MVDTSMITKTAAECQAFLESAADRDWSLGRRLLSALTATAPGGRAWLLAWNQAHDTLAFYRRIGWQEPEPLPGNETDVVVFLSPN